MRYDDMFWNLFANYGFTEAYISYRDFQGDTSSRLNIGILNEDV